MENEQSEINKSLLSPCDVALPIMGAIGASLAMGYTRRLVKFT